MSGIPKTFLVYMLFINKQRICSVEAQSRVAVISTFRNSKVTMLADSELNYLSEQDLPI